MQTLFSEPRCLHRVLEFLELEQQFRLAQCCRRLWKFLLEEFAPTELQLDSSRCSRLRIGLGRAEGRTNLFLSNGALCDFLKRICPRITKFKYRKSYALDRSWRSSLLSLDVSDELLKALQLGTAPSPLEHDSHLSLLDMAIALIVMRDNVQELDLTSNLDPGAPTTSWAGLPPLRDCDWYMVCPMALARGKSKVIPPDKEIQPLNLPTVADQSLRPLHLPLNCCAGDNSFEAGALQMVAGGDADDHLICCQAFTRGLYWFTQALRTHDPKPYNESRIALSVNARASVRPHQTFSKLKRLSLSPPDHAPFSKSAWSLICLFRALNFDHFPELEELALLGDFVLFRYTHSLLPQFTLHQAGQTRDRI